MEIPTGSYLMFLRKDSKGKYVGYSDELYEDRIPVVPYGRDCIELRKSDGGCQYIVRGKKRVPIVPSSWIAIAFTVDQVARPLYGAAVLWYKEEGFFKTRRETVDYTPYGLVKIGDLWVPGDQPDVVAAATNKHAYNLTRKGMYVAMGVFAAISLVNMWR